VGRALEDLLASRRCPWPLHESAQNKLTTRVGTLAAITLAPREMLRNAMLHGARQPGNQIGFDMQISSQQEESEIIGTITNTLGEDADKDKVIDNVQQRCSQLQSAVPFARCLSSYDRSRNLLQLEYRLLIRGQNNE